ncbi:protein-disulfide reductase DsbD domain-containing protein [Ciceribacter ferrooxidans]|uniref:protein-disulfide reductase DsbD domain-containing protein n=1 Tax=Ciceribacter ferrooxidans TaxID=2509717 RepID=UPI00196B6A0A|nr:protein-disulfide reductase DsbD domain-containing protein [Ciceribacter ferrooxidans]
MFTPRLFRLLSSAIAAVLVAALAPALPARAASSDWALNEGGRMRLVVLPADAKGLRQAVLQIEPEPGWITYWREPGDSGVPPAVTVAPSGGFTLGRIDFPVPKRIDAGDLTDIGYDHSVALPLSLSGPPTGKEARLEATAFIGLCKNICIPFQAVLTVDLPANEAADADEARIVADALESLPAKAAPDFAVERHAISADLKRLTLEVSLPKGAKDAQAIVTGPSGYVFFASTSASGAGGKTVIEVPIGRLPKNYAIAGKRWDALVIAGGRAIETVLAFD